MMPRTLLDRTGARCVLTCEHASHLIPERLGDLGLTEAQRREHIGWDVGAAWLTEELSWRLSAPAVLSSASRLVVDCNRQLDDADLIPAISHGVAIPGNREVDDAERSHRVREYYEPFHDEVDRILAGNGEALLLSVHSFTPHFDGRDFDVGVLFDDHAGPAADLSRALRDIGLSTRMNEPYSGFEGLIFSAQRHGRGAGVVYLEIEVNSARIATFGAARDFARAIAPAIETLLEDVRREA